MAGASIGGGSSAGEDDWGRGAMSGMGDLMNTLSCGTATRMLSDLGRAGAVAGEGLLPKHEDQFRPAFKPKPSKEEVKQLLKNDATRNYKNCVRPQGDVFGTPDRMRPEKMHDTWTLSRMNVPDRTFKKDWSLIKYHSHPELMPEPNMSSMTQMHRQWLKSQGTRRDKELHDEYHALQAIDRAKVKVEDISQKKAIARDIMSREHAVKPNFSGREKLALGKVKAAVAVTRMFNKMGGIDRLAEEEERARQALTKAKSVPCLRVRPLTPEGRATHHQAWGPTDPNARHLRESTPWRQADDSRSLTNGGGGRPVRPGTVA
mmetsp:Transcript_85238/g.275086  ORF Transcript_85238/g.275086 Transcript_85238/m.275086 type:complete len:318 (-) Transcript_85238:97-1050(-)